MVKRNYEQSDGFELCYGDNIKKLEIAFTDTSEKVVIDETSSLLSR